MFGERQPRQNLYYEHDTRHVASYEMNEDSIVVRDPVWGTCEIGHQPGDEVFLALRDNDLVRRAMGIEQLTLSRETSTIPGTTDFSRWEHIWGSVVFVRKMTERLGIDPRERTVLQLRTFVSDLGHTAFSHLGDWMFQDTGTEDQHDEELGEILEGSGVGAILRDYGFSLDEVVFPPGEDWIECKAPDLCVDRVDYGAREMQRWLNVSMDMGKVFSPDAFSLRDGKLVMRDEQSARLFGKAFLLLSSEHWGEPVHKLQLKLKEEVVKRVLVDDWSNMHPRDLLYTTDAEIVKEMFVKDKYLQTVWPLMQSFGLHKRRVFAQERSRQLGEFLWADTDVYPDPLEHYGNLFHTSALLPPGVSMVPVVDAEDVPDYGDNKYTVDFFLKPLKLRTVDPLFVQGTNELVRLSAADPHFRELADQQVAHLSQAYVARLHVNEETKHQIEKGIAENQEAWKRAVKLPRMDTRQLKDVLHTGATYAQIGQMVILDSNR